MHAGCSLIHNSQRWKQPTYPSAGEFTRLHAHDGIPLSDEKEWGTDMYMNESRKHCAEGKKPYSNVYLWSVYVKLRKTNPQWQKTRQCLSRSAGEDWLGRRTQGALWAMEMFCILTVVVMWVYMLIKAHWALHLKWAHFIYKYFKVDLRQNVRMVKDWRPLWKAYTWKKKQEKTELGGHADIEESRRKRQKIII